MKKIKNIQYSHKQMELFETTAPDARQQNLLNTDLQTFHLKNICMSSTAVSFDLAVEALLQKEKK